MYTYIFGVHLALSQERIRPEYGDMPKLVFHISTVFSNATVGTVLTVDSG
jgi:hypothetical protein